MQFTTKTVNYKGRNKYGDYMGYRKPVKGACDNGRWELTRMYVNTVPNIPHENWLQPDQSNYKWIEGELSYIINDGYEDVAIQTITGLTMTPVYTGDPHAHHYKIVGDKMYWNDVDFGTTVVSSFSDRVYCSYNGVVYSGEAYSRSVPCAANTVISNMSVIDYFRTTGGATSAITIESGGTEVFFEAQATRTTTYTSTKTKTEVVTDIWNEGNGKLYLTSDIGSVDNDAVDFGENPSSVTRTGYVRVIDDNVPSVQADITVTQDAAPVSDYLTLEIISGGTISWHSASRAVTISYSLDSGETWTDITSSSGGTSFNVNAGDKVMFKGSNSSYNGVNFSGGTASFNAKGSVMSLIYGDGGSGSTLTDYAFATLFRDSKVVDASELSLPSTSLTLGCYVSMFKNCSMLTAAPALPATSLTMGCYDSMFYGCTSLTTAPALPATSLAQACYQEMFNGCTSLTAAPTLPATSLTDAHSCYESMFAGCSSLTTPPALPATELESECYYRMFRDCTSLAEMPALPATSLTSSCYEEMFYRCTSLTTAKVLRASTLASRCYSEMFQYCSSLSYIRCHATNISAYRCTEAWTSGVATGGTFVKESTMEDWTTGTSGIPSGWTVLNWGPIPPTPISGDTGGGSEFIPDEP